MGRSKDAPTTGTGSQRPGPRTLRAARRGAIDGDAGGVPQPLRAPTPPSARPRNPIARFVRDVTWEYVVLLASASVILLGIALVLLWARFESSAALVATLALAVFVIGLCNPALAQPYRARSWRFRPARTNRPRAVGQRTRAQQRRLKRSLRMGLQLGVLLVLATAMLIFQNPGVAILTVGLALALFAGQLIGLAQSSGSAHRRRRGPAQVPSPRPAPEDAAD